MLLAGRGAEEERNKQKKTNQESSYVGNWYYLLHWAKKISQTPKCGFVGKITARPSSFKTLANTLASRGLEDTGFGGERGERGEIIGGNQNVLIAN
jgi:hypothetical protein